MNLFQIWTTHNRPWSVREIIVFLIILSVCSFFIFRAVRRKRLKLQQGAAVLALILFLGVVFASTVFTRTPTVRRYELIPFWSWYEVMVNHSQGLLIENLLNMILLLPVGILLPMILDSRLRPSMVFLIGVVISAVISITTQVPPTSKGCRSLLWKTGWTWDLPMTATRTAVSVWMKKAMWWTVTPFFISMENI